jgi:anion-transporting  ArsA/GET3 family ATPase
MMDPTGGGAVGKAAGELLQEMQKAQNELQKQTDQLQKAGSTSFQQAMEAQQTHAPQAVQQVEAAHEAARVLSAAKINAAQASTRVGEASKVEQSRMLKLLDGLISGQDKLSSIMHLATSGKQFSPNELLAMQAGVYRFSQELDLTSKVVEQATTGMKQTMNTQV